jgi:hypothetical protein
VNNWFNPAPNVVNGYGFSVSMPPGFVAMPTDPMSGGYFAWPAGSTPPPNSPALIWLTPVLPIAIPGLLQHYYQFDNPMVAMANAQSLGLMNVLRVAPLRQANVNGVTAVIREFDALSMDGQPVRMTALLLRGPMSAAQCIVGVNLYRWVEFAGATLQFVANIQLAGTTASPAEVRSVIDPKDLNRVEMQLVNEDSSVAPIMNLPTNVQGQQVFHIHVEAGGSIKFGNVEGTNIQFGNHNIQRAVGQDQLA